MPTGKSFISHIIIFVAEILSISANVMHFKDTKMIMRTEIEVWEENNINKFFKAEYSAYLLICQYLLLVYFVRIFKQYFV